MDNFVGLPHTRAAMVQEDLVLYTIPIRAWRKTAGSMAVLPSAGDGTDLATSGGTHGAGSPVLKSSIVDLSTVVEKARTQFILPVEYISGGAVLFRIRVKMPNAADPGATTIDLECYKSDNEGGVGADICATGLQTYNTSYANYDFVITPTGLVAGDRLDLEITNSINDNNGGAGDQQTLISLTQLLLSVKG